MEMKSEGTHYTWTENAGLADPQNNRQCSCGNSIFYVVGNVYTCTNCGMVVCDR